VIRLGSRHFAAQVGPGGIHLVEYSRGLRQLQVVSYAGDPRPVSSPTDLAARLGDLLEANGAAGGRLSLAVNGFGTYYQIMSLPAAPPEVLRPVVLRELRHVYPELNDALVGFGRTRLELEGKGRGPREREVQLLVGLVPRDLISLLQETLANGGIVLEHVTIAPRAVQQLHQAYVRSDEAVALLLASESSPLLGFFNRDGLQFFAAPRGVVDGNGDADLQPLVEQMERGALFMRQQFRGQRIERVLVSGERPPAAYRAAFAPVGAETVEMVGPDDLSPGALAALGVALDARSGSGLNLLPPALRPPAEADPWVLQLALVSALVLVLASAWWGASAVRASHTVEQRAERTAAVLARRTGPLGPIREVVAERQAHRSRIALLEPLEESRRQLQEALWGMNVAPAAIQLDSVTMRQAGESWEGAAVGSAIAPTSAEAARAVNDWYRGLARGMPPGYVRLRDLASVQPDSTDAAGWHPQAVRFQLVERVPVMEEKP
jgi:hypothetical protein